MPLLWETLKYLFPAAVNGRDYVLQDHGDGPFIFQWNLPEPKPTKAQLLAAAGAAAAALGARRRRAEILVELATIDTATARPLRAIVAGSATDDDHARLGELDARSTALRAELAGLA